MDNHCNIRIRYMCEQDLPDVIRIQSQAYTKCLHESSDVFKHKLSVFKEGCFVALSGFNICGYLFSHPWVATNAVPFNSIYTLPVMCDIFYIHDCAVDPDFRNFGIGLQLFTESKKTALAYKFHAIQLTCISGMQNYWKKMGFVITPGITAKHYGDDACLMHFCFV